MGGLSAAVNTIGGFNSINIINPASYGKINFTTIDAGLYSNATTLSNDINGVKTSQSNSNFRFSHITFAIPVSKHSALSFGLVPYSELGYS